MPSVLAAISVIGTVAMLWVGGSIVTHGLHELHLSWPYDTIEMLAQSLSGNGASGVLHWLVTAFCDAVVGLAIGITLIPIVNALLVPFEKLFPEKNARADGSV